MKKIALITGANKGIGFETARQLGKLGYLVLVGSRNTARGEKAVRELRSQEIDAQFIQIDPTDVKMVQLASKDVEAKYGVLDVLVNNAGVFLDGDKKLPSEVQVSIMKETYAVNVFGVHEVTTAFWKLLNKSQAARIVNVSSGLGSLTLHSDGQFEDYKVIAYDSSKAALNMMTLHYAHQWKGTPHKANAIHPGTVMTDMNPGGELTVEEGAKTSVRLATIDQNGPSGGFFYMEDSLPW
jgi:NAD(P)-dependent dehydrogenase (short-subunit alcohol dehydrogenase family)